MTYRKSKTIFYVLTAQLNNELYHNNTQIYIYANKCNKSNNIISNK